MFFFEIFKMKPCSPNPLNLTLNFAIFDVKELSDMFKRGENDYIEGKHGFFSEYFFGTPKLIELLKRALRKLFAKRNFSG